MRKRKGRRGKGFLWSFWFDSIISFSQEKMKDLSIEGKVRIQRAGCLDRCELGPVQVSYPEGRWFSLKTEEDVDIFLKYYIQSEQMEKIQHLIIKEN